MSVIVGYYYIPVSIAFLTHLHNIAQGKEEIWKPLFGVPFHVFGFHFMFYGCDIMDNFCPI
jgi:hypothetical protein